MGTTSFNSQPSDLGNDVRPLAGDGPPNKSWQNSFGDDHVAGFNTKLSTRVIGKWNAPAFWLKNDTDRLFSFDGSVVAEYGGIVGMAISSDNGGEVFAQGNTSKQPRTYGASGGLSHNLADGVTWAKTGNWVDEGGGRFTNSGGAGTEVVYSTTLGTPHEPGDTYRFVVQVDSLSGGDLFVKLWDQVYHQLFEGLNDFTVAYDSNANSVMYPLYTTGGTIADATIISIQHVSEPYLYFQSASGVLPSLNGSELTTPLTLETPSEVGPDLWADATKSKTGQWVDLGGGRWSLDGSVATSVIYSTNTGLLHEVGDAAEITVNVESISGDIYNVAYNGPLSYSPALQLGINKFTVTYQSAANPVIYPLYALAGASAIVEIISVKQVKSWVREDLKVWNKHELTAIIVGRNQSTPAGSQCWLSLGDSASDANYLSLSVDGSDNLTLSVAGSAGTISAVKASAGVTSLGVFGFEIDRSSVNVFSGLDATAGTVTASLDVGAFDQCAIGALLRTVASAFSDFREYSVMLINKKFSEEERNEIISGTAKEFGITL